MHRAIGLILLAAALALLMVVCDAVIANYGECSITVNDEKPLRVQGGRPLLATLKEQDIFIPSACGGRGSCGLCKVTVTEGAGDVLPTELPWLSPGEIDGGTRLACQVKVKQDMNIEVEPEVFDVRKWQCRVRSNRNVATFIKELVLELPEGEARGYICENFGALFRLPDLGVIGSNGLANPRDFLTPHAWYEDREGDFELVAKFQGSLWRAKIGHSPLDVVAWHGNYAPCKYDLRNYCPVGAILFALLLVVSTTVQAQRFNKKAVYDDLRHGQWEASLLVQGAGGVDLAGDSGSSIEVDDAIGWGVNDLLLQGPQLSTGFDVEINRQEDQRANRRGGQQRDR